MHIELVEGVRRIVSIREVVDAEGGRIISNEIFARGPGGPAVAAAPLRDSTATLFAQRGFDPAEHRRENWGAW